LVLAPPNFVTIPIYLVPVDTFTLVPPIFTPFDLVQWMTHVFFSNHRKISLFFKASFVTRFSYGPANCSHSPKHGTSCQKTTSYHTIANIVPIPGDSVCPKAFGHHSVFGHHSSSMRAGLHLNYYRHITEEAELFFFFSLVCNFLALRDTHTR